MEKKKFYMTTAIAYTSENPISEIRMRLFWQTVLPGLNGSRGMRYSSRRERMSMDRKSRSRLQKQESPRRSL